MTAIWCENSALSVGRPRRSAEWSTESSCTSVARWISSTTAASVTARGSLPPAARWLSNNRVGRNSFPFMRSRCSFTSLMIGKSAAMIRRSSSTTCSSSAATGPCTSRSAIRGSATGELMLPRLGERLGALLHVEEPDVHREHAAVQVARVGLLALLLQRAAQPVQDPQPLLVARGGQLESAPQNRFGHAVCRLLEEAHAQHLGRAELPVRGA